jgi:hypothetical protein
MKKNEPGCRCCGLGYNAQSRSGNVDRLVYNTSAPPVATSGGSGGSLDLDTLSGLGAGVVSVGVDVERRRLLVQRTNGEVWTVTPGTHATELLWATTSDAAANELMWVKYHHSWGCASAWSEFVTGDPASTRRWFSLDANGDYIQGPYNRSDTYDSFDAFSPRDHCVDPSGNLYYHGLSAFQDPPTNLIFRSTYYKNDAAYSWVETTDPGTGTFAGVEGLFAPIFHDGTDLYALCYDSALNYAPFPTDGIGFYRLESGVDSSANHVTVFEDIEPSTDAFITDIGVGWWDDTSGLVDFDYGIQWRRISLDLSTNRHMTTSEGPDWDVVQS